MGGSSRASRSHRGPVQETLASRRRRTRRALLSYAAAALTIYAGAWHLAHHPRFAVSGVEVEGNVVSSSSKVAAVARAALVSPALSLLPMENAYLARAGRVEEEIVATLPEVVSADVTRDGNELVVRVAERERFGYWCRASGDECFALDPSGFIFAREAAPAGATRFEGLVAAENPIRERYATESLWGNLRDLVVAVRAAGFSPTKVSSEDGIDFKIELAEGPYLVVDATHSGSLALENLGVALEDATLGALSGYEYVDLRLPHKVFLRARQ